VIFSADDLVILTEAVTSAWLAGSDRDWSRRAGTLDWTCTQTADHAVDTVLAPALFLASRKQDSYPGFEPLTMGRAPTPEALVEGLNTATRVLVGVVATAPPETRAIIWRRPVAETRGPEDFPPRAGLELILHAHDVCVGLGVPFTPPESAVEHLCRHVASWPFWSNYPGWSPLSLTGGDLWFGLLQSTGRA
jgi:hypothetical protein